MEVNEKGCKLFVGGLSHDTTDATLLEYFKSFGTVISAIVLRDSETLSSRGFGFVSFSSRLEAQKCLDYGSVVIDNKEVEIKLAKPRPSYLNSTPIPEADLNKNISKLEVVAHQEADYIPTKVFVGGLLYSTGADSLDAYFTSFGEIDSTEIIYNKETKISRGFGFVQFRDPQSVKKVIYHQKNLERHKIDGKKVEVKRCLKKNDPLTSQPSSIENRTLDVEQLESKATQHSLTVPLRKRSTSSKAFSFADAAKSGTKYETAAVISTPKIENYSSRGYIGSNTPEKLNVSLDMAEKEKNIQYLDFLPNFDDINFNDTEQSHSLGFNKVQSSLVSKDKEFWLSQSPEASEANPVNSYYHGLLGSKAVSKSSEYFAQTASSPYIPNDIKAQEQQNYRLLRSRSPNSPPIELNNFRQQSIGSNSYRDLDERTGDFSQFDYQNNSNWN